MISFRTLWLSRFTRGAVVPLCLILPVLLGCESVPRPDPAVAYIAFGDSSTKGPSDRSYPAALADLLAVESRAIANEGHGGEDSSSGLTRLRGILEGRLYPNAHTLLYWEGGKDVLQFVRQTDPLLTQSPSDPAYPYRNELNATLDSMQSNVEQAIGLGHQAGLSVYVTMYYWPPEAPISCDALGFPLLLPPQAERAREYVRLLNERIRHAAANQGATLVDVETIAATLAGDISNYVNCNHLSAKGNEAVAGVFREAIQGAPGG